MAEMSEAPYVGPRPFTSAEETLFFGREHETKELVSLILSHPVVVLCAASGVGKTSLLNAKIAPELFKRGCEVFSEGRVGGDLPAKVSATDVKNIFVFNALMTLRRQHPKTTSTINHQPTLLGQITVVPSLTVTLRECLARAKENGKKQKHGDSQKELVADAEDGMVPRVLVFDQFEEIFTKYQDRWQEREGFFDQIACAFEGDDNLRVVFAMREEYLASLQPYAAILPDRLRTQYRLEGLRRDAALLAVKGPVKNTGRFFGVDAAEKLVENLLRPAGSDGHLKATLEFVEPLHLQLVCRNLWRSLGAGVTEITKGMIRDFGDVDQALTAYYEECLRETAQSTGIDQRRLRIWFSEKLILPDGSRNLVYRDETTTAGMPNSVIDALDLEQHLLRSELRGTTRWYELSHDRFIGPIQRSNENWRNQNDAIGLLLEEEAERWATARRPGSGLLRGIALRRATAWRKDQGDIASPLVSDFIQTSLTRARALVMLRVGAGVSMLAVVALIALWALYVNKNAQMLQAKQQKFETEMTLNETRKAQAEAEAARNDADTLITFMQEDLTPKLDKLGHLEVLESITKRVLEYHTAHPPKADDLEALAENATALRQKGDFLLATGRLDGASTQYLAALVKFQKLLEKKPNNAQYQSELASSYEKVGDALSARGDRKTALERYRDGLKLRENLRRQEPGNPDWQSKRGLNHYKTGLALYAAGDLAGALTSYREYQDIMKELAKQDPNNLDWQRNLAVSDNEVGRVLSAQGDLTGALKSYREFQAIMKTLVDKDPSNAQWQRDLGISYSDIGDVLSAQGDLNGALNNSTMSLTINERLTKQDPSNTEWQRNFAVDCHKVGDALFAQGNHTEALKRYREYQAIMQTLATKDPSNADWQRSFAISCCTVGDILYAQGDLVDALKNYRECQAIMQTLATKDPSNADWQQTLAMGYSSVGDALYTQGDFAGAFKSYSEGQVKMEKLVQQDVNNAGWQRSLAIICAGVGDALYAQGDVAGALKSYREYRAIMEKLIGRDPANAGWQRGFCTTFEKIGDVLRKQGDVSGALKHYQDSLSRREKLAGQDPSNALLKADLASTYEKIGDLLREQHDLADALRNYQNSLLISEKLIKQDPKNASWQSNLSSSCEKIGMVLSDQGGLNGALKNYRAGLLIAEKLGKQDPSNATWQAELGYSYFHVGFAQSKVEPNSKQEAQAMMTKGRDILRDLKRRNALTAEQQKWLDEVESELSKAENTR